MKQEYINLLYHEVIDNYSESGFQNKDNLAYMHKTEIFRAQAELISNQKEILEKVSFTFDDGGISNLKSAKILEDFSLKGLYFITTNKIGYKGFLNQEDIRLLSDEGHLIGSHSHTHPMIFRTLKYNEMLNEWKISKDILEQIIGKEITACSVPGGDSDTRTYKSAAESGFKTVYDSEPIVHPRHEHGIEILGRFSIKAQTSLYELDDIIHLRSLKSLQRNRKIKSTVKKLIFPIHHYLQSKKNGT